MMTDSSLVMHEVDKGDTGKEVVIFVKSVARVMEDL